MSTFNQRNHDFCKGLADAQFAYIEAERLCAENDKLQAENAELVMVLHELEQEAVHAYRCLQHDCEQVLESEQHFFKKWWSSDCENAKLRELVEAMPYCMYPPKCLKCPLFSKSDPSIGGVPECKARAKLRELGIEVPK